MKPFTRLLIGISAALIAAAAFVSCTQEATIKIGVISPLSGTGAVYADLRDGLQLAADEVNARGGVNKKKLELIVEDDHGKADETVAAFGKIETRDRPLFFVSALSSLYRPDHPDSCAGEGDTVCPHCRLSRHNDGKRVGLPILLGCRAGGRRCLHDCREPACKKNLACSMSMTVMAGRSMSLRSIDYQSWATRSAVFRSTQRRPTSGRRSKSS